MLVVLRPESVEIRGARVTLSAKQDLRPLLAARNKGPRVEILLPFQWETNAALHRFEGKGAIAPKDFATHWLTVSR